MLAALAILALALMLGLGLLAQQREVLTRLEAKREANRAVEAALEGLRSGALELTTGARELPTGVAGGAGTGTAEDLTLVVRARCVEPPAHLYRAEVEARYTVLGEPGVRRVETLFWRPGGVREAPEPDGEGER